MTPFDVSGKEDFSKHCGKRTNAGNKNFFFFPQCFLLYQKQKLSFMLNLFWPPPGWLSGERVGLMTWWLRVRSLVEVTCLSGVFSPLTSAEACEKSSSWL